MLGTGAVFRLPLVLYKDTTYKKSMEYNIIKKRKRREKIYQGYYTLQKHGIQHNQEKKMQKKVYNISASSWKHTDTHTHTHTERAFSHWRLEVNFNEGSHPVNVEVIWKIIVVVIIMQDMKLGKLRGVVHREVPEETGFIWGEQWGIFDNRWQRIPKGWSREGQTCLVDVKSWAGYS